MPDETGATSGSTSLDPTSTSSTGATTTSGSLSSTTDATTGCSFLDCDPDPCLQCKADEVCRQGDGGDVVIPPECVPAEGCMPTDLCSPECAAVCGANAVCHGVDGGNLLECSDPHDCDFGDNPWYVCQDGEKCNPSDPLLHGWYSGTTCVPVDPDPKAPGEPCTIEGGPYSGIDDCEVDALCWNVDPGTLKGTCVELCSGSAEAVCKTPGTTCALFTEDLAVCLKPCHPLIQDCATGEVCMPSQRSGGCMPDASGAGGQLFDPCWAANECDPGLFCANPKFQPNCDTACCGVFCDVMANEPCPGLPGLMCIPWYGNGMAPPGDETLGFCGAPP